MKWAIHRVGLSTHDLEAAQTFFGVLIGLGEATALDDYTIDYGQGSRGLRIQKPKAKIILENGELLVPGTARHVAIEVADLGAVVDRLDKSKTAYVEATEGDFDIPAIYTVDSALNVVAFCQSQQTLSKDNIQPWEMAWGWGIHHVNLPAGDVRAAIAFYTDLADLREGKWRAPDSRGDFSIDPKELSILTLGQDNRGLHIIRPDAGFALRNNFAHNPSIGGHPAFHVKDVAAVRARLEAAGFLVSDAGVYAMIGMHQIYVLDPTGNMIEVNQYV